MATTPKLSDLLNQLREAEAMAARNLEDVPYMVRPGFASSIDAARREVPELVTKVLDATVPHRLVGAFATGDDDAVELVASMMREHGELVLEADEIYRQWAAPLEDAYGPDRVFNTSQFARLMSDYRATCIDMGIDQPVPLEYQEAVCYTREDTVTHVRHLVRQVVGDSFNVMVLKRAVVDAVVEGNLTAKHIPIFVTGATAAEIPGLGALFSRHVIRALDSDTPVSKEFLQTLFKQSKETQVEKE